MPDGSFNRQHCLAAPAETEAGFCVGLLSLASPSLWVAGIKVPIKINGPVEVIQHGRNEQSSFHKG